MLVTALTQFYIQATKAGKLDVPSIPNLFRELMAHWKSVTTYLSTHAAQQQMQGVRNQVSRFMFPVLRVDCDGTCIGSCFVLASKFCVVWNSQ